MFHERQSAERRPYARCDARHLVTRSILRPVQPGILIGGRQPPVAVRSRRRGRAALTRDPNRRWPNTLASCARRKPWSIPRRAASWGRELGKPTFSIQRISLTKCHLHGCNRNCMKHSVTIC